MLVDIREFLQNIGRQPPAPVILFCPGKPPKARDATFEPFLAEQAVELLTRTYVDPTMKDLAYAAFYADETKVGAITLEARTMPFLTERRVVLVRNAERYSADSSASPLLAYIENPSETTLLMMIASHLDKRTKFFKACEKSGVVVECPERNEREVGQWAATQAEARGKQIEPGAIQEIIRRAGTHLSDVNNALNIVIAYVGDRPVVREPDVIAACADVAEEQVWALTDAIAASEPGAALVSLRKLLDLGRHEDEIIGTINWLLKSAYAVAQCAEKCPELLPVSGDRAVRCWRPLKAGA